MSVVAQMWGRVSPKTPVPSSGWPGGGATGAEGSRWQRWVARGAWLAFAAVLVFCVAEYAIYAVEAVRFPFGLDYSEGLLWQQARWIGGPHAYGDISQYPFVVYEYPPVYLAAVRALAALGGGMLAAGRAISVVASIAACGAIFFTVREACAGEMAGAEVKRGALIAAVLPATLLPIMSWSPLMRVDMLAFAFTWAGIAFGAASFRRPGLVYAAVAAFALACFTKQIYIAGAACMLPLCAIRAPARTLKACAIGAIVGVSAVVALDVATQGGFVRHVFFYNVDRVSLPIAARETGKWLAAYPIDAALVAAGVGVAWWSAFERFPITGPQALLARIRCDANVALLVFMTAYLLLTTAMLISAGKTGASRNYFIEWMGAWCLWLGLLAGFAIDALRRFPARGTMLMLLVPLLLTAQALPVAAALRNFGAGLFSPARCADDAALLARVRAIPGELLSDDMVLTIEAGREVGLEPGILLELEQTGMFDERKLVGMLQARAFGAVVTAYDPGDPTFDARYRPDTTRAMLKNYPHVELYGDYRLRLPQ